MLKKEIAGTWALVTGAGSGMGRMTSLDLAKEGTKLILVDISLDAVEAVAKEIEAMGGTAEPFKADLTSWEQVQDLFDKVQDKCGAVEILVNCVGMAHMAHMVDTTLEDWRFLFDVNLYSIIHMVKAFAPPMMERGSGSIVNISSGQAFFAVPTWGAYATTKFAVDGYSEALRYELACYGITVSCVYPGVVKTPFYDNIAGGKLANVGMKILLGVASKPEALSKLIVRGIKYRRKRIIQWFVWPLYWLRALFPWPFEGAGYACAFLLKSEEGPGPICPPE